MDLNLTGKRVLISAATRGVNRAIATAFLDEGAIVSFCGRRARRGEPNPSNKDVFANPMEGDGVEEAEAGLSAHGRVRGWGSMSAMPTASPPGSRMRRCGWAASTSSSRVRRRSAACRATASAGTSTTMST